MPEQILWREVTANVLLTTLQPEAVNVGLVLGTQRALLVDAATSPTQGAELLASARARAGVPVTHVVVTHNHWDHWFGLAGMEQITSVAHEQLAEGAPSADTLARARAMGLANLPQPDATFSLAKPLNLGEQYVEMVHFGGGHTASDVFVFVPGEDVLFVGDMLEEGADPQFDETSDVKNWPRALDGILGATKDSCRIIPGHGEVLDREAAFIQRAELGMIHGNVEWLVERGTKLEEAADAVEWPFSRETLDVVLPLVYAKLADEGIKPRSQLPITGI